MNESEKIDPRELSPLALAFVGDSVLELLVRQRLVEHHRLSAGKLNAEKVKYVSAKAQFREEQLLEYKKEVQKDEEKALEDFMSSGM